MLNNEALNTDSVDQTKRDKIRALALTALQTEIQKDPQGRGYAGKKADEIADLMNSKFIKTESENKTVVTTPAKSFLQAFNEIWKNYILLSASQLIKPDGKYISDVTEVNSEVENVISLAKAQITAEITEQKTQDKILNVYPPRVGEIFAKIPYTSNFVTADDITEAM